MRTLLPSSDFLLRIPAGSLLNATEAEMVPVNETTQPMADGLVVMDGGLDGPRAVIDWGARYYVTTPVTGKGPWYFTQNNIISINNCFKLGLLNWLTSQHVSYFTFVDPLVGAYIQRLKATNWTSVTSMVRTESRMSSLVALHGIEYHTRCRSQERADCASCAHTRTSLCLHPRRLRCIKPNPIKPSPSSSTTTCTAASCHLHHHPALSLFHESHKNHQKLHQKPYARRHRGTCARTSTWR